MNCYWIKMTACCFLGITFTTGENNICEVYVEREGKKDESSVSQLFIQIPKTYPSCLFMLWNKSISIPKFPASCLKREYSMDYFQFKSFSSLFQDLINNPDSMEFHPNFTQGEIGG